MVSSTLWYDLSSDLTIAKNELNINDDNDDTLLNDYGKKANRKIDNLIFGFQSTIPTLISSEITDELKQAAILDVARRYKIKIKSFESAKEYENDFDNIIESIKIRAKAEHAPRTRIAVSSQKYDTEDDVLFSQRLLR